MDLITKSPGLFHIAEKIFMNLNQDVLILKCQQVNEHWKSIVRNPLFWYEKCYQMGIFEKNFEKVLLKKIIQALFKDHAKKEVATITCIRIISESIPIQSLYSFLSEIYKSKTGEYVPRIKECGWSSSIHLATLIGYTEIVKILTPLTDNPNAPDNNGATPSSVTKNVEIRRILESINHL